VRRLTSTPIWRGFPGLTIAWAVVCGCILGLLGGCKSFSSQGLNAEGVRLFEQTRIQEAMEEFQRAIDRDPTNADGYYNLAACYHRLATMHRRPADVAQAERYYYLCLDRAPNHRECYRGLAVLLVEQDRKEEAFRLLQNWADRSPGSPDPKIELARLHEECGDREKAKQLLADALLVDATNPRALAALGRIREMEGEVAQALANYQQSLASNPFQPEVATRVAVLNSSVLARSPSSLSGGSIAVARPSAPVR